MKTVFVCSPYSGNTERNVAYAYAAMKDCFIRNEAPFAPHLLYPHVLDDLNPQERELAMKAGAEYLSEAGLLAVYIDLGTSIGMQAEIDSATYFNVPIEYRKLPNFVA